MRRAAIIMDRDGTISEEVGYVNHLSRWRLLPRSLEAIRLVNGAGLLAIVATNQSGVARGYFSRDLVEAVHGRLRSAAEAAGARLDAIYYCPHHPSEGTAPWRAVCDCRKPKPGMILRAAHEHDINLEASFVVGDSVVDIEAGSAVGVPGVLVLTGYGRGLVEHQKDRFLTAPVHTAEDLLEAVRWILERRAA
ncbi:MAG: D,D-heptose 1,7-bisphosphate phosphatase [Acidobacteria bacterium 13_1_40CM_4_69_4]|nr:MAG: D,D-heptose 1,7-bisphosphate phosphatase [Acidobacteria bacterium 13_1_40CM_4_69_4]